MTARGGLGGKSVPLLAENDRFGGIRREEKNGKKTSLAGCVSIPETEVEGMRMADGVSIRINLLEGERR